MMTVGEGTTVLAHPDLDVANEVVRAGDIAADPNCETRKTAEPTEASPDLERTAVTNAAATDETTDAIGVAPEQEPTVVIAAVPVSATTAAVPRALATSAAIVPGHA
jgi:hypothetical protein